MKKSEVTDHIKKTHTISHYDYDAFGRRTLVQDEGSALMRTLYDGMSFDIIREQESFADGYFTNTSDTYVDWQASGEESSSRYRYIGEEAGSNGGSPGQANSSSGSPGNGEIQTGSSGSNSGNFRANSNADYRLVSPNRSRNSVTLFAKGEAVATNKNSYSTTTTSTSSGNRSGTTSASTKRSYFGTDMIGSVRSATHDDGLNANYYDYDVFGKPFGETSDYGYVGKPYDPVTGLSNYGYRDYSPKTARFTTVDPIRDGHNWYAYCSNDPVNFVDLWGLSAGDKKVEVALIIFRDLNSYNITQDRANFQNGNLDSALFINKTTGEILFIDRVQTVANYPLTKPDTSPAANSFPDTIAATSFDFIYKTETTAATGPAAVIGNTKTISGKSVDANGNTENGATPGRTLWHSPGKPDGSGDYRIAYSQACFIPETSLDNDKVFDTLEAWGVKDEDVIKGKVEIKKPWEKGI